MARRLLVRGVTAVLVLALSGCDQTPTPPASNPAGTGTMPTSPDQSQAPPAASGPEASPGGPGLTGAEPTAADLILADLAAGKLDEPTALLFRVYAIFGDPRLPEAYVGAAPSEDRAALHLALAQLDTLPADVANELRPFLVRPTDPTSVFHDVAGRESAAAPGVLTSYHRVGDGIAAAALAPAPVVCNPDPLSDWGYALGAANFKVWGECGAPQAEGDIQLVVAIVDELWDAEAEFLGRQPLPDAGQPAPDEWLNDEGGDTRIDIYMVNGCVLRGGPCRTIRASALATTLESPPYSTVKGVGVSSAFVLVPRTGLSTLAFRSSVAHELFHVFQNAMNLNGTFGYGDWHWFVEASAKWAEWHFVPAAAPAMVAPFYGAFQNSPYPLDSTAENNEYGSFTWPLFMEQQTGGPDVIARTWQAIEGQPDVRGVTNAIDAQLPFKDNFRIFALRDWNQALGVAAPVEPLLPEPPTGAGRPKPSGNRTWGDINLLPAPPGPLINEYQEGIAALYTSYAHFTVDEDVGQVILGFSGLSSPSAFDADALVKVKDQGWQRRKLKKGTTTWCMDSADDDIEEFVVVLADHDLHGTLVYGQWTVQSPLEPCLSYQIHIDWVDTYNHIEDKFTFDGWVDTVDPNLSGNGAITLTGTGTISGKRPGWTSCNPGIDIVPSGNGDAEFVASISGDTVSFGAFPALSSTDFGVSTQPFTMDRKGGTLTIRSEPPVPGKPVNQLCPHSWQGTITATMKLKEPMGNAPGE